MDKLVIKPIQSIPELEFAEIIGKMQHVNCIIIQPMASTQQASRYLIAIALKFHKNKVEYGKKNN